MKHSTLGARQSRCKTCWFFEISAHRYSLPINVASGFSLKAARLPVIVVNGHDPINRRIFTLIHEFVHLGLRSENQELGICDTWQHEPLEQNSSQSIEIRCNLIAGSILVPKAQLLQLIRNQTAIEDEDRIQSLASQFKVSREVIIRRFLELDLVDYDFYREKSHQYWLEWGDFKKPPSKGGPPRARVIVGANGTTFVRIVLNAYGEHRISLVDVASYLGTRAKHLPEIQQLAGV